MAEHVTVARPYAEAAFSLARQNDALPVWAEMLRVAATVSMEPRVRLALDNPKLGAPEKEALLLSLCADKLNAEGRLRKDSDRSRSHRAPPRNPRTVRGAQGRSRGSRPRHHRDGLPLERRAARPAQGSARAALRQEDRGDGQHRRGADRRRQDHRRRYGHRWVGAGRVARDGEPVTHLNPTDAFLRLQSRGSARKPPCS